MDYMLVPLDFDSLDKSKVHRCVRSKLTYPEYGNVFFLIFLQYRAGSWGYKEIRRLTPTDTFETLTAVEPVQVCMSGAWSNVWVMPKWYYTIELAAIPITEEMYF